MRNFALIGKLCRPALIGLLAALILQPAISAGLRDAKGATALNKKAAPPKPKEDPKAKEKKPDEDKPFQDIVKDMEVVPGLFTFYRKADENKVYLEILPNQLDQFFLFSASVEKSIGERGLYSAQMGGNFPFSFHKNGKSIQWLMRNTTFTADPGSPSAKASDRSFPDSILGSTKILSQPHPDRKSLLINLSDLLVADVPNYAAALKEIYKPTDYRFDRNNSAILKTKSFPKNALVEVFLHYTTDNPKTSSATLPDERSIPFLVKYDFSALPSGAYQPRLADDRVGHFLTVREDFTSDHPSSPYVRYIHRWDLQKADPEAELSAPKEPIVYWLENTIPVEYREWMKEGVLLWNKAFEKIGFKNAIEVRQQPDDADWDPADTRYHTIRWFVGIDASFAIGPSRANPFTGEIYDADIGISEGIIRAIRRQGEEFISPIFPSPTAPANSSPHLKWNPLGQVQCEYGDGLAQQAAFAANLLAVRGALDPATEEKLLHEYIVELVAHEVGHTLGLRHNFRGSTILPAADLIDEKKTEEVGQSASVMDYNPIIIAGKGQKQGHFVPVTLGPYDYWAIEYAYKPFKKEEEKAELAKIASRAADPVLPYSTDEDALGTYSASAIDPLVNQFDASSDPLEYFRGRMQLIEELWNRMEDQLLVKGEGYQVLRRAFNRGINEYYRGILTGSKYVGGIYHYRDHYGDANGRSPYVPVPAAKQREAITFLRKYAFDDNAFAIPARVLNKLATERLPGVGNGSDLYAAREDYPWRDSVLSLQRSVLARLLDPVTLARIGDNELRFEKGEVPFTMADLFSEFDSAIWSELDNGKGTIPSLRRNLQREYLKHLLRITLRSYNGYPEDATSLARASLVQLQAKLHGALTGKQFQDPATLAHLQETDARLTAVLNAQSLKGIE